MRVRSPMLQNALWLTGSELFLRAISMLFQVYLSNRMGAAGVGLLQLLLTVGTLATTLALSGVKVSAMYLTAREAGRGDSLGVCSAVGACLRYALLVSGCAAALLYSLSGMIAERFVQDRAALAGLRAYAVFLPCGCLASVMHGYSIACGKVRRLVLTELAERFLSIGLTVALLYPAQGDVAQSLFAVVTGASAPPLLSFLILFAAYRREHRTLARRRRKPMAQALLKLSLPLALSDYLRAGLNTVEQFLIPYGLAQASSRYAALSAYGTVVGMVFPVLMFPSAILHAVGDLLVPELSRCTARGATVRIRSLTERFLRLGALFASVLFGVLFCGADALGMLLYHSGQTGFYLRLLSPMVLFLYLDVLVDGMQKGLGQQVYTVRYNTATNVLDVLGLYTLLPRFGLSGYLFTYAVSHLVNFFLSLRRLLTVTQLRPSLAAFARLLTTTLISIAAASALPVGTSPAASLLRVVLFLLLLSLGCRLFLLPQERAFKKRLV